MAVPLAQADNSVHRHSVGNPFIVASSLETPSLYTRALGLVRQMAA